MLDPGQSHCQKTIRHRIECFHITSQRPCWCPKTKKWRPCWYPNLNLWELNSFLCKYFFCFSKRIWPVVTWMKTLYFKHHFSSELFFFSDSTDKEARDHLLEEIELMKSIGSHRNIVSMLGCWVNSEPIFLLLEYLAYGDLLNWLRRKRQQVT